MPLNDANGFAYRYNAEPKCPHCDAEVDVMDHELFDLYEEGAHDIDCPLCGKEFRVVSVASFMFYTDEQE